MKLIRATIENYKLIENTGEWKVNKVTCLIGKNESGKSATLEALHKLKPDDKSKADFTDDDFPRRHAVADKKKDAGRTDNVVTSTWLLEPDDVVALAGKFPEIPWSDTDEIVLRKGYDNKLKWTFPVSEDLCVKACCADDERLDDAARATVAGCDTFAGLYETVGKIEPRTAQVAEWLTALEVNYPKKNWKSAIEKRLEELLPTFIYFKEYYRLPGRMAVDDFVEKMKNPGTCPIEYKVFEALMSLADTTAKQVTESKRAEELVVRLETIENAISESIFKYWRTNKHLTVKFQFDHARPGDGAPFNTGWVFSTRIRNERHKASVLLDVRSSGFVWFFSFLVWFYNVKRIYGEKLIILLDEPGLTLHGTAQQDLLRYFNEELRPHYQLIYTTHAPFMIDTENPFDLRGVEDVVIRKLINNEVQEQVLGTKVTERILTRDRDTLLPLEGIAGFAMTQSMFVGPNVVVVEGPSEYAFIKWFSSALSAKGRVGCDLRWAIVPAEGAPKVSSFVTLFKGRGLRIAALMDYHDSQKKMVDKLAESKLLDDGWLLKTTQFAGKEEADIEDLLGWELYRHLVNKAMNLHQQIEISEDANTVGERRLVKFVEEKFRAMPVGVPEFDHYKPAEYLLGVQATERDSLPGIDVALNRFEALFTVLNALLAKK